MSQTTDAFQKCFPAFRTNIQRCASLTVCDSIIPTIDQFDEIFKDGSQYRLMEGLFMYQLELKACGVQLSPFQEFLMANKVSINERLTVSGPEGKKSIQPFIMAQRKHPINNVSWHATNGFAANEDGSANPAGAYWSLTLESPTMIPSNVQWFNARERLFVEGLTDAGVNTKTAWQIVSSTSSGNSVIVVLTPQNAGSYLPAGRLASPVNGIAYRGTANVNDYESFCKQPPGLINTTFDPFWYETTRDTLCEDELTDQYIDLIRAENPLFEALYDLPAAEYNRQAGQDFIARMANQILYGKPISANQTLSNYNSLESIETTEPNSVERCIGRRANAIGFYEQLAQCERVVDLQQNRLSLVSLARTLYRMMRIREFTGHPNPSVFDIFMPSTMIPGFNRAFMKYWKARGEDMVRLNSDLKQGQDWQTSPLGFKWKTFQLEWPNVTLNVMTDKWFDDTKDDFVRIGQQLADDRWSLVGNRMWILDWRNNYNRVVDSNRVVNKTGDLQVLASADPAAYACIMKMPKRSYSMTSTTYMPMSVCPAGDIIIENISGEIPDWENDLGDYDENYGGANVYPNQQ